MKALKHKSGITIVVLATLLVITGCQSVAKVQPTTTPTETVVVEREVNCPISNFNADWGKGAQVIDPELGAMTRGVPVSFSFDCSEPYLKGKAVGFQDFYSPSKDTTYWNGVCEIITDEGGVWMGEVDTKYPIGSGTLKGDGNYTGLQMKLEYNNETSDAKIRVTKVTEQ